jgi:hypothetical protein
LMPVVVEPYEVIHNKINEFSDIVGDTAMRTLPSRSANCLPRVAEYSGWLRCLKMWQRTCKA